MSTEQTNLNSRPYPVVPSGSVPPPCFMCGGRTSNPEESDYPPLGGGWFATCDHCSARTYFDYAEIDESQAAHVLKAADGYYWGQANTRVYCAAEATLRTRSEWLSKVKEWGLEVGTYSIIPLRRIDLVKELEERAARRGVSLDGEIVRGATVLGPNDLRGGF